MPIISGGKVIEGAQQRGPSADSTTERAIKVARAALAAADTAGGLLSWQNPESGAIEVIGLDLDITTPSSGACTGDFGATPTSGTTSSDNLIDGLSLAAAGLFNNVEDKGTNGKSKQRLAAGKWLTGSVASGASAGLVGTAYIRYMIL
jgi:hypothetical protein